MLAPFGYCIFCDDIRQEVGGKVSFIGSYDVLMQINSTFPCTLPKFAIAVTWIEPARSPARLVTLQVFLPGDADDKPSLEGELEFEKGQAENPAKIDIESPDARLAGKAAFIVAPLVLKQEGEIRVRARRGKEIHKVDRLTVRAVQAN